MIQLIKHDRLEIIIQSPQDVAQLATSIMQLDFDKPMLVDVRPYRRKRSLDQNALYWMWLTELSEYLQGKGRDFATKEWCHDAMRHSFLGWEEKQLVDVVTGEITETRALRSTTKLDKGAFTFYLEQIEGWALGIGCLLTVPENCEYMKLKREQND